MEKIPLEPPPPQVYDVQPEENGAEINFPEYLRSNKIADASLLQVQTSALTQSGMLSCIQLLGPTFPFC